MAEFTAVAVFVMCYGLIATERFDRVAVALGGATVLLAFRVVTVNDAFHSERFGVDWGVIGLLLGMMIIVGVLSQTGVFDYLGIRAAQLARGRPFAILTLLVLITAFASSLLDNVATVLLVAPVTIELTRRLAMPPVPFLVAEAFEGDDEEEHRHQELIDPVPQRLVEMQRPGMHRYVCTPEFVIRVRNVRPNQSHERSDHQHRRSGGLGPHEPSQPVFEEGRGSFDPCRSCKHETTVLEH